MRLSVLLFVLMLTACEGGHQPPPRLQAEEPELPAASQEPDVQEVEEVPPPALEPEPESLDPHQAQAETKLRAIAQRQRELAKKLHEAADQVDDHRDIGLFFDRIGIPEASCYAKGVRLGLDAQVAHLKDEGRSPKPATLDSESAHLWRIQALKHLNFASVVESHIGQAKDQLVLQWNLDCAGHLGIPETTRIEQTGVSTFYEVMDDGKALRILGDIEAGFSDKVIAALEAHPDVETVSLGSGGGLVMEAMKAGRYIRKHGYSTMLWNGCYSACPLVFMGGKQRRIWSPYPVLGFHRISRSDGTAVSFEDTVYIHLSLYLHEMDVDAGYVMNQMLLARPQEMHVVDGHEPELCDANIATWIHRSCTGKSYDESAP